MRAHAPTPRTYAYYTRSVQSTTPLLTRSACSFTASCCKMRLYCIFSAIILAAYCVNGQQVEVVSAIYDPNGPDLIVYFSEQLSADTDIDCNHPFVLQNDRLFPTLTYTLVNGSSGCFDHPSNGILFKVRLEDFSELYYNYGLFDSNTTSYLRWTEDLIQPSSIYSIESGVINATYFYDRFSPNVLLFSLDMDAGIICLTFDSPINVYSIDPSAIYFTNSRDDHVKSTYDVYILDYDPYIAESVCMQLSVELIATLETRQICRGFLDCFIYFNEYFANDVYGNYIDPIPSSTALQVANYIADTTPPNLVTFELNFVTGVLALAFNSAVNASTLNPISIKLTDGSTNTVTLTGGSINTADGLVMVIHLSESDLMILRSHESICKDTYLCYISISSNFIVDLNGNPVVEIPLNNSLSVQNLYIKHDGDVYVTSAQFHHNGPTLNLEFSEPVDVDLIYCNQQQFVYQNRLINPTSYFVPQYRGWCSQTGPSSIDFHLEISDYRSLLEYNLFFDISTSVVSWNYYLGQNISISPSKQYIDSLIIDMNSPVVIAFDLDLYDHTLKIFFDSLVDTYTFNATFLTLQDHRDTPSILLDLTGGYSSTYNQFSTVVCAYLDYSDVYQLTDLSICTNESTCYLSYNYNVVEDPFGNRLASGITQVSRLKGYYGMNDGFLSIEVQYLGCYSYVSLLRHEPFIIRPHLDEKIFSMWCNEGILSWKMGSLENVTSPLTSYNSSYHYFYNSILPENYGVFVCTRENETDIEYTENFIVDSSPFLGSPKGDVIYVTLYSPLEFALQFGPNRELFDEAPIELISGANQIINTVTFVDYACVITAEASDVLYSVSGQYRANLTHSQTSYSDSFSYSIVVIDPVIQSSETDVEIHDGQRMLHLSCVSDSELPITWREGLTSLTNSVDGVTLTPSNYYYELTIDLTKYTLSGNDIVCEIEDPEGERGIVASATFTIKASSVEQCEPDVDDVWGIMWDYTNEGSTDVQDCPQKSGAEVTGYAIRMCLEGGIWGEVDVTNCASKVFSELENQVEQALLEDDPDARQDILSDVLPDLADAATPSNDTIIFPQDLITANDLIDEVILVLTEDTANGTDVELQTDVVDVIDSLLSEEHAETWNSVTTFNNESDASLLLNNAENYGDYLVEAIESEAVDTNDTIILEEENIKIRAEKLDISDYKDVVFPPEQSEEAQITIPASHLSSRKASAVVNMQLENIVDFLPQNDEDVVAVAPVISSQVKAELKIDTDTEPVVLVFTTYPIKYAKNPRCVYWDYNERLWRTDGVVTLEYEALEADSYKVTCESSHLTPFTAFVDIIEDENVYEWTIATYVGAGALAGCGFLASFFVIIAIALSCGDESKSFQIFLFAHLGLFFCMACAGAVALGGLTEATSNDTACTVVAALLQYFTTGAFTWGMIIAFLAIVKPVKSIWIVLILIAGLVIPAVPTAISVGILHEDYGTDAFCWIVIEEDEYSSAVLWANAGPMAAFSLITVLLVFVAMLANCIKEHSDLKSCGIFLISTLILLMTLFVGGSWAFGLVTVNELWDPAEWIFMGCSLALGIVSVGASLLFLCAKNKIFTKPYDAPDDSAKYWQDKKGLLPETKQLQSAYEMKDTGKEGSAYSNMGVTSDEALVEMMEETPQDKTN